MDDERRALEGSGQGNGHRPDLVDRAGQALGWLYRSGWDVARRLPGGESAQRQVRKVGAAFAGAATREPEVTELTPAPAPAREPMRVAMAGLLERSVTDSKDAARDHYFEAVLRQLLPDEARIVSALSDGTVFPLVHLATRGNQRLVLENASTVGRVAGVIQPGLVPLYVTRILRFGLAEVGEEDGALGVEYELLLTDDRVRDAEARIKAGGRFGPRIIRLTLRLSELGAQFWAVCDPSARGVVPGDRP